MKDFDFNKTTGKISMYFGDDTDVIVPSEIDGVAVTSIGSNAFYYCESVESITIPDSVTSIGDCAFSHCTLLKSINIPDSVTTIGRGCFHELHIA